MRLLPLLLLLLSAAAAPSGADAPAAVARGGDSVAEARGAGPGAFRGERGGEGATTTLRRLATRGVDEAERQRDGSGALPASTVPTDGAGSYPSIDLPTASGLAAAARPRLLPPSTGPPATARPTSS